MGGLWLVVQFIEGSDEETFDDPIAVFSSQEAAQLFVKEMEENGARFHISSLPVDPSLADIAYQLEYNLMPLQRKEAPMLRQVRIITRDPKPPVDIGALVWTYECQAPSYAEAKLEADQALAEAWFRLSRLDDEGNLLVYMMKGDASEQGPEEIFVMKHREKE